MKSKHFQYAPLDHHIPSIRLVTVLPSPDPSADIKCAVSHDVLGSAKYIALSYTWGDANDKVVITVADDYLEVTKTLHVALRHVRLAQEPITLWVDAICINQTDVDERNHQVRQMIDIYKKAEQVYIWLGEPIEHMDAAISLMNRAKYYIDNKNIGIDGLIDLASSKFRKSGWQATTELLHRPWWSRVWILQEATYGTSPIVLCGSERFSWNLLDMLGTWSHVLNQITWALLRHDKDFYCGDFVHSTNRLEYIVGLRRLAPVNADSILELHLGARQSDATDPRDKVFAILGLLGHEHQLCEIDYRKSVRQVYTEAAAGILKHTDNLRFLSFTNNITELAPGTAKLLDDLPSWVPPWIASQQAILVLESSTGSSGKGLYAATKDSRHQASCDVESGILRVAGFPIDVLKDVGPVCSFRLGLFNGLPMEWFKHAFVTNFEQMVKDNTEDPDSVELIIQAIPAFWRLILADQWAGKRLPTGDPFELENVGKVPPESFDGLFKLREAVASNENQAAFRWRSIFFSHRVRLGLAPPGARPGDIVFGILGCSVPYVVRQCENGYQLLGEW